MGLKLGANSPIALSTTNGATLTATLDGASSSLYQIVYDNNHYDFQLKNNVTEADFPKTSFSLTGACNENADWTSAENATPGITVTWTVEDYSQTVSGLATPIITGGQIQAGSGSSLSLPSNLDAAVTDAGISTVHVSRNKTSLGSILSSTYYTYDAGSNSIVFDESVGSELPSGTLIYNAVVNWGISTI